MRLLWKEGKVYCNVCAGVLILIFMDNTILQADKEAFVKDWNEIHKSIKTDLANIWYKKRAAKKLKVDAKTILQDLKEVMSVLKEGHRRKDEIAAKCHHLVALLRHLESNKEWYKDAYLTAGFIVNQLNEESKRYDEVRQNIMDFLVHYDLGEVIDFELIAAGAINLNIRLRTTAGTYYLRIYNERQSEQHIDSEHKLLEYLASKGFIAIGPIKSREGSSYVKIKDRFCSVFKWEKGTHFKFSLSAVRKAAKTLATYHLLVKDYHPSAQERENAITYYPQSLKEWLMQIEDGLFNGENSVAAFLRRKRQKDEFDTLLLSKINILFNAFQSVKAYLAKTTVPDENFIMTHGDFHGQNLLIRRKKIAAILDFDYAKYAPKEWDIFVALLDYCYAINSPKLDLKLAGEFAKAYRSISMESLRAQWIYNMILLWYIHVLCRTLRYYYLNEQTEQNLHFGQFTDYLGVYIVFIEWLINNEQQFYIALS